MAATRMLLGFPFLAVAIAIASMAPASGCGSSSGSAPGNAIITSCSVDTDCDPPQLCVFARCHAACQSNQDCPSGLRCVVSVRPSYVCQLADEASCTRTNQCPGTERCAVDDRCRDGCSVDGDCLASQVCREQSCADPAELDAGMLSPTDAGAGQAPLGAACGFDSDCAGTLVCRESACDVQCKADKDCAGGARCVQASCVAPDAGGDGG